MTIDLLLLCISSCILFAWELFWAAFGRFKKLVYLRKHEDVKEKIILTRYVKGRQICLSLTKGRQICRSLTKEAIFSLKSGYYWPGHVLDRFSVKFPFSTLSRHPILFAYLAFKKNYAQTLQALATPAADRSTPERMFRGCPKPEIFWSFRFLHT